MNLPSINDTADQAYEKWDLSCACGELCPSCGHIATSVIPISTTMDLLGTVLFRCEQCGFEWPDRYQDAIKVSV